MAKPLNIDTITHDEARRANIPTAEFQSAIADELGRPKPVDFGRRNPDLDPQLVWRGKYDGDDDLVVHAPPLYIQEKVHPKTLIEDLRRESQKKKLADDNPLFAYFNGFSKDADRTDFYRHDQNWTNRMILGDSLQVMASLAEREGLRGQVQCIYLDPPYGIKFNSNFQWSTTSRDVKDGKREGMTREPEQVKAFRDTWRDGIHSYLSYLRDRFILARDLLTESGSIFVQIGDENVHLIKSVLLEIFGESNYINTIAIKKKSSTLITESIFDFIIWFSKNKENITVNKLIELRKSPDEDAKFNTLISKYGEVIRVSSIDPNELSDKINNGWKWARVDWPIVSQHPSQTRSGNYIFNGIEKKCSENRQWSFDVPAGLDRLSKANRLFDAGGSSLAGVVFYDDRPAINISNLWNDVKGEANPIYVVQTAWRIIQRCILMTTNPGDLVLDPTCGSGTTAYVAEQWGRRWITIDTSRVALTLARARIMGARYPWYVMADSKEGRIKEAELSGVAPSSAPTGNSVRQGFVYQRVPHVTLKSIANNAEIDVIYDRWQKELEPLRAALNEKLGMAWEEWEIPREVGEKWSDDAKRVHGEWWDARIKRQEEIDASISAHADYEKLYDKPYEDKGVVRVTGPFTVESLSPHRMLHVASNGDVVDPLSVDGGGENPDFVAMILDNLREAGVQQAHKEDKITFTEVVPMQGRMICAEGRYMEGEAERRAAIFIGPEFGTVSRLDLVRATREAADLCYDVLISCAFNYDAQSTEFSDSIGRVVILKARMNADLHMAADLKNTGKGNLFVVFGEPDIELQDADDGKIRVRIRGVDVYDPNKGEVRSDDIDGIACWFVDTDYNSESFFVRQAYFLGAGDPYKALRTTLKSEISRDAWETLHSDTSRPFDKPRSGQIAVKVINHLGDEVLKVFDVD